jgi:class 3 adenylate cyclase
MPGEERKLATVLFADLVGSTALAGGQDPERVRAMLDRFYDAMAAEVERAGGTVEKFVGDAVMAAFGAPVAHVANMPDLIREPSQIAAVSEGEQLTVRAGQGICVRAGEWVRYSTPGDEGAKYISVCVPASTTGTVHRDE